MRRGQGIYWSFYTAGAWCLAIGIFGVNQLAIIAIPLLFAGAVLHWRWYRSEGATPAQIRPESMNSTKTARSGLRDRYEGIMTSLTHRED